MNSARIYFYPMLADPFGEASSGRGRERWGKYRSLSESEKDVIVSDVLASSLENVSASNGLSDKEGEVLADIVRRLLLKEISEDAVTSWIQKNIPRLDSRVIAENLLKTIGEVVNSKPISADSADEEVQVMEKREEPRVAALVQITLQEALKKYPRLGEQALSGNPIKLKVMPDLVRPSIKNWISDYYEKIEARKHDSIERGNYLFHSENSRRLTTGDRQKVGMILRALDEDSLITVDSSRQEVVFENGIGEMPKESGGTSFSSPHKFPSELKRPDPGLPMGRQNQGPSNNIVNLRNV